MFSPKQITWFFLKFLIVFGVLATPLPGVREGYGAFFRGGVNLVYGSFGSQGRVRCRPLSPPVPNHDMEITLENRVTGGMKTIAGDSRLQGYLPTMFTVALLVASPIPWRRRWRALAWGFALINAYVALRVLVFLLWEFSGEGGPAFIPLGQFWRSVVGYLYWLLVVSFAGVYVVPIPLWFLVTFRRSDWTPAASPAGGQRNEQ